MDSSAKLLVGQVPHLPHHASDKANANGKCVQWMSNYYSTKQKRGTFYEAFIMWSSFIIFQLACLPQYLCGIDVPCSYRACGTSLLLWLPWVMIALLWCKIRSAFSYTHIHNNFAALWLPSPISCLPHMVWVYKGLCIQQCGTALLHQASIAMLLHHALLASFTNFPSTSFYVVWVLVCGCTSVWVYAVLLTCMD